MKKEIIDIVFEKMKDKNFGESMCNETKLRVLKWCDKQLHKHIVSNNEVALIDFLLHLNDKGLINNHDFDYEKEAKKYIKKKLINDC